MDLVQLGFDYGQLDSDTREVVQLRTGEIKTLVVQTAQYVVEIGQKLSEVSGRLPHGQFGPWLKAEFRWEKSTAYRFMQVANAFGDSSQIGKFAPSALYLLASPSTPDTAREEAIERAEAGETITYSAAREIVDAHKDLSRLCPYCGCVYSVESLEGGVSPCPNCGDLHSYSGVRDVEKYGPLTRFIEPSHLSAPAPHVSYNSGNNEWYTPAEYILSARRVMGNIDLDPASNPRANETVGASRYFTTEDDGLAHKWEGRVWMNPPYATGLIAKFCIKLVEHFQAGDVQQAIVLVNNATETAWFHCLLGAASAIGLIRGRVNFVGESGETGTPLQGQALLYFGDDDGVRRFVSEFSTVGAVLRRAGYDG